MIAELTPCDVRQGVPREMVNATKQQQHYGF